MTSTNRNRAGFTLIELLVVISILAILSSLILGATQAVRERQYARSTDDVVQKLQVGIDNQVKVLVDQAGKDQRANTAEYSALLAYTGDPDRAVSLLAYCRLRQAFPQTFSEAQTTVSINTPVGTVNFPPHKAYANFATASGGPAEHQSAVLLYAGLSGMGAGGNAFATDDATSGAQTDISVGNFPSARVFKDAWGSPVAFFRFWQAGDLNAAPYTNAKPGKSLDPFDPEGKLFNLTATWTIAKKSGAEGQVFVAGGGQSFDSFANNKVLTPVSAGKDKAFGTADDAYGYRLRKLGNKGTR